MRLRNGKSPSQLIKMGMAFRGICRYLCVICSKYHEVATCCSHGYYIQIFIIENDKENGLGWKGLLNAIQSNPPVMSRDIFSYTTLLRALSKITLNVLRVRAPSTSLSIPCHCSATLVKKFFLMATLSQQKQSLKELQYYACFCILSTCWVFVVYSVMLWLYLLTQEQTTDNLL